MNSNPERIQVKRYASVWMGPQWVVSYRGRIAFRRTHGAAVDLADDWAKWCWKGPVKVSDQGGTLPVEGGV